MPGNELGDRVHNFFAADNSLQGQCQSQVVEGNWPVLNNNFWVGSQRQTDVLSSSTKSFPPQNSDFDRGQGSYPFNVANGLNFNESNLRSDFLKIQSPNEQPKLNGYMHGGEFRRSKQNDGNFLALDTDSDRRHLISSIDSSVHEVQTAGHPAKALVRPETSVPSVSFDLFGGQRQMSHQQSSMLQSLQRQPSGLNDMQQQQIMIGKMQELQRQQQQLMIGKMQELQRQQQLQHLDLRQQNFIYQASPIAKQASGSQPSTRVNGTPDSDALQYPWPDELGTNWLNHGSSTLQGSPNGLVFPPNLGQSQPLVDLVPRQVDQSLYGVPVSSSRGLSVNQYSQMETTRFPMPEMSTSSNFLQANRQNLSPDQVGNEDGTSISRQKFQSENMFGHATIQSMNTGIITMGGGQQLGSMQRNAPQQNFPGSQDLTVQTEILGKKTRQMASPPNEISLDPTEEKILFGSDDDIWAGFGKIPHTSGDPGNLFDNGGLLNALPSIQSGSWSALMQSAVAETSSGDVGPQEGWHGLTYHGTDGPANHPSVMHIDHGNQETTLANDNMQMHSPLRSRSIAVSDDTNNNNVMELNQFGHKFENEPGQRLQTEMSQRFVQSVEEAGKWSNLDPRQDSVAEGSQVYRNASQHSLEADRHAKTISTPWAPGRFGNKQQQNGFNALEALPPGGDRVLNINRAEKMSQNSQNNEFRPIQGDAVRESSLRNSNAVSTSAVELDPVRPKVGNAQVNEGIVSLNNAASVANSSYSGVGDETSPFVQNKFLFNQWKTVNPSPKSEGGESLGRRLHQVNEHNQVLNSLNNCDKGEITRHEMDSCDLKENSIDCHRSNLYNHTSVGFRESGLSDASNSRPLAPGKQKSTNQLSRKVAVPRKFQYHPMGNIEEDVEPSYGMKQPIKLQVRPQQNTHFGVSKIVNLAPRDSMVMEKGQSPEVQRANKGPDEEPFRSSFPVHMPSVPVPICQPFDSYIPNKASSSGQNMLELLHKVDQSRDYGAMMHLGSSECNPSSQQPEAEKNDGSIGRLQRSQSSASQGFGLQLGPPSEWLQIPDHSLSSQNAQGTVNLLHASHAAAEMVEKGHQMVPGSSVQYLHFPNGESQIVLNNNKSIVLEHAGNENSLNKMPLNFHTVLSSGTPNSRSHIQNQQIERGSGKLSMKKHIDSSLNGNTSTEIGSAETIMLDASGNIQKDNLALSWGAAQQTGPNDTSEGDPALTASARDPVRSSQHFGMPSISLQEASAQMLHNKWTNVSRDQQHTLGAQYQVLSQPNIVESSSVPQTQVDLGVLKDGNLSTCHVSPAVDGEEQRLTESSGQPVSYAIIDPVPKMKESLETASLVKNHRDDSPSNSASVQKDIEAFGRTLKPNRFSSQNYSLITQMRTLKDAETDPSRASKKMKGPDNILHAQQVALMAGWQDKNNVFVGDSLGSNAGVLSEDSTMLRFSKPADNLQRDTFQHGDKISENVPQRNSCSDRVEHPQVSPQMAPAWFDQYGALKKGEMLSMHNASKVSPLTRGEPPFTHGKPPSGLDTLMAEKGTVAPTDSCQNGSTHQGFIPSSVANGHLASPLSSQLNVTDQHLVILKMKKRKSTSELHPWHKEILEDSQKFWTLSVAEAEWSKVTNCLKEKVGYDAEFTEDGPPLLRSKRRLVLTTQLLKQLFGPPPAGILSSYSCFEDVAYAVSRIALGDACSTVSHSIDLDMSGDNVDQLSAKGKPSDRNRDQSFMKYVEFLGRTSKLENDFVRLEKASSLLDLRLECQDLEKFSVINRFAKFHGRGQNDNNADTASINGTANTQKPCPQRYVTAVPVPRSLPDPQCLSL